MDKKVVIIGGGIAGIYAAMNGFDTEILEMHSVAGGQCTAWERKNYCFDYCLHWLVGTSKGAFHEIWRETNVINDQTEIIDHDIHLEIIYPAISEHIEVIDIATPKTDVKYTGVKDGAYEGFMPSKENMMKSLDMQLPKLKNFYMAGQWLFPGGGLPPSAQTGKWVVQLICKKEKRKFVSDK